MSFACGSHHTNNVNHKNVITAFWQLASGFLEEEVARIIWGWKGVRVLAMEEQNAERLTKKRFEKYGTETVGS